MWWQQFCRTLLPHAAPATRDDVAALNRIFRFKHGECVYCGDPASTSDHFRPLVRAQDGMPSGAGNDMWNRVPACSTCNASKGTRPWRDFMACTTGKAPRARGVRDCNARAQKLAAYEREGDKRTHALFNMRPFERRLRAARAQLARARDIIRAHYAAARVMRNKLMLQSDALPLPRRAHSFSVSLSVQKFRTRTFCDLRAACASKAPIWIETSTRSGKFSVTAAEQAQSVQLHFQQCQ